MELPTAVPYFGAIALLTTADLPTARWLPLLALTHNPHMFQSDCHVRRLKVMGPSKQLRPMHAPTALMSVHSFRDLVAWQRSMALAVAIDRLTRSFPTTERFGLTFQLRKAATSIPSNVAEGHAKPTRSCLYHLEVAIGSNAELQTQLELSFRAELAAQSAVMPVLRDAEEVGRLLRGLCAAVKQRFESNTSEG